MTEKLDWTERTAGLNKQQIRLVYLMNAVRTIRRSLYRDLCYCGPEDFLLQHGQWFAARVWKNQAIAGEPRQCFRNSMMLADGKQLKYVEGMALRADLPIPFHHAWNADTQGLLVDATWLNDGDAYLGVIFPNRMVRPALRESGAILEDYAHGYKLFRRRWTGQ